MRETPQNSAMSVTAAASVRLGSDQLLSSTRLHGTRVGIVCNHASVDRGFVHIVDRLAGADRLTLAAIFGPQHGFRSDVQDNMIETPHRDDPARRVPIYSLYSETREPTSWSSTCRTSARASTPTSTRWRIA
jgi:uncharacterized protein YbbC (DUF1343 family)